MALGDTYLISDPIEPTPLGDDRFSDLVGGEVASPARNVAHATIIVPTATFRNYDCCMDKEVVRERTFGEWLRGKLASRDWSGADFARAIQAAGGRATPGDVSRWLRDQRTPNPDSCYKIADVLHLPVDEVLTRAGHRPPDYDVDPDSPPERFRAMMRRIKWDPQREQLVEAMLRQMIEFDRSQQGKG